MTGMRPVVGLLAAIATMAAGCGRGDAPELAPAGGTVTYNGEPLEGANVVFTPDAGGPAAYGMTGPNGEFTLSTRAEPGAMVGSGKVVITAFQELDEPKEEHELTAADLEKMSRSRIPEKYGRAETSGLRATVTADGENQFPFELTD